MWPLDEGDPPRIGPYRLLARLGEGGMGTVYLAEGSGGERIALKSIRHGYADEPGFRARFAREIETSSMVRAEGIARVVDSEPGDGGQRPWVATEFVAGASLQQLVAAQGPLPVRSAGALALGLARALAAVHGAGLIHRDVKPSNILLTVEGPRLIDFGVARLVDASTSGGLTRTGTSVGSPGYMSPEQVLGRSLTPASDVFSLGSVLVYATTGALPFEVDEGANQHALMFAVVQQEPSYGQVPAELRDIVGACLAKEAADRPDMSELARRLSAYAAGPGDAEPWLPARALAEVARISGRALAQGEWRPRGGGDAAAETPPRPAPPAPPPAQGLPYVPTVTAPSGPPAAPAPPPQPPAGRPEPTPPARPPHTHYVRQEPIPAAPTASPWGGRQAMLRSPRGLATALSWLFGLYIGFKCLAVALHSGFGGEIGGWKRDDWALWVDVDRLIADAATLVTVDLLFFAVIYAVLLTWFWRVRGNAEVFAPGEHRYTQGMAVGGWFIPVAGWIIPGKIAYDTWYASLRDRDRGRPGERGWQTNRRWEGRVLLGWWWASTIVFHLALTVLFFLPGVLEGAIEPDGIYFDRMLATNRWAIFLNLLCIPSAALSIAVVHRLTELQEARAVRR